MPETIEQAPPVLFAPPAGVSLKPRTPPLWRTPLGWLLLIPLFYITANGTFILHSGDTDFSATGQTLETSAAHKVSIVLVCLIWMALAALRFTPVSALARRTKLILSFPVLALVSCAWSTEPRQTIISAGILLAFTCFSIYVASRFPFQKQFELIVMIGALALPASVLLALLVPSIGATDAGWRGVFGHKQSCAAVCTVWLITALYWRASGIYQKIFRVLYILMSIGLIVMSKSRTGWALALVALALCAVVGVLQRFPPRQSLALLLIGSVLASAALYGVYLASTYILTSVGKDPTLSERTIIWAASWQAALQHPMLGYGFEGFWRGLYGPSQNVVLVAGWALQQAQDGYLDIWLGLGAVGVALFAFAVLQALKNAAACFHAGEHRSYVAWCIGIVLCSLLYNIGESSIAVINMNWFVFVLALIGLNQAAAAGKELQRAAPKENSAAGRRLPGTFPTRVAGPA